MKAFFEIDDEILSIRDEYQGDNGESSLYSINNILRKGRQEGRIQLLNSPGTP